MNILFVSYGDFRVNSLVHIAGFAAGLSRLGHACAVAVPRRLRTIADIPSPAFRPLLYHDVLRDPRCFPDGGAPDIIHAWTPRHLVATFVVALQARLPRPARLVVHMEDNEEHLAERICGLPFDELLAAPPRLWEKLHDVDLIHPRRHRLLLHAADAVTHIIPGLVRFVPRGQETRLLMPGLDAAFVEPRAPEPDLRRRLGVPPDARLVVYPGSVNPVNAPELRDLYRAVVLLDSGSPRPVRLVRTGNTSPWFRKSLSPGERAVTIDLGFVERGLVPRLLSLADVLVQPGKPGPFNDYRLPSKLPEFLASGRPVVMPAANLAAFLEDGRDAVFLGDGSPADIAARCRAVFADDALAARVARGGREAALRLFDAGRQAALLDRLYATLAARPPRAAWDALAGDRSAQESALFPGPSDDPGLAETLSWARENPRATASAWRRKAPAWLVPPIRSW